MRWLALMTLWLGFLEVIREAAVGIQFLSFSTHIFVERSKPHRLMNVTLHERNEHWGNYSSSCWQQS